MSRVKLNLECKIALLEQGLKSVVLQGIPYNSSDWWELGFLQFFKLLTIAKSFLHISRRFKVYRISLLFFVLFRSNDELKFCCSSGDKYDIFGLVQFQLTFKKARKLFLFLQPRYFSIQYLSKELNNTQFNEAVELLRITNGKLGLIMSHSPNDIRFLRVLHAASHRIHELECEAFTLDDQFLPKMSLDVCKVDALMNIEQLKRILRHDIRKLRVCTSSEYYLDGANIGFHVKRNDDTRVINWGVKSASVFTSKCKFRELEDIVTSLAKYCPDLQEIQITATFGIEERDFEFEYLIEQGLLYRYLMEDLKFSKLASIPRKSITFYAEFFRTTDDEYDHSWVEKIKDYFNGWDYSSSYYYNDVEEINLFSIVFGTYDEEGSQNIEINLTWPGEMDAQLAWEYPSENSFMEFE